MISLVARGIIRVVSLIRVSFVQYIAFHHSSSSFIFILVFHLYLSYFHHSFILPFIFIPLPSTFSTAMSP
ncbi:hypothetical protein BDZ91DRAFT_745941 [Kalaharituber pfeilii]|nr:hypothetical protein BDZ91DRAFT_745941 [Kalaharituber pfeilii]